MNFTFGQPKSEWHLSNGQVERKKSFLPCAQSENIQSENAREERMIISDLNAPFDDHSQINSESTDDWHSDIF